MERLADSDAESDITLKQKFPGSVLETLQVPERNQVCHEALGQKLRPVVTHQILQMRACISAVQLALGSKLPSVATSSFASVISVVGGTRNAIYGTRFVLSNKRVQAT